MIFILTAGVCLSSTKSHAFLGDGGAGWAQIPYLIKILSENYKRYKQIKNMIQQAKDRKRYLELLNAGLENSIGLVESLPIEDEGLLGDLRDFQKSVKKVSDIYGQIPTSPDSAVQLLHDQTVAESLRMANDFKDFAKKQEENSMILKHQGRTASPKGAQRMTVESNAMILKSMSQLMRLETQNLKLQSEILAMKNRESKKQSQNYNKLSKGFEDAFKNFKPSKGFIKF